MGPKTTLASLALLSRVIALFLLILLQKVIPPFDSSHQLNTSNPTTRWDAIHFLSIAKDGYQYEQQLAFQPGWMAVLRASGWMVSRFQLIFGGDGGVGTDQLAWGGCIAAISCYVGAVIMLYL